MFGVHYTTWPWLQKWMMVHLRNTLKHECTITSITDRSCYKQRLDAKQISKSVHTLSKHASLYNSALMVSATQSLLLLHIVTVFTPNLSSMSTPAPFFTRRFTSSYWPSPAAMCRRVLNIWWKGYVQTCSRCIASNVMALSSLVCCTNKMKIFCYQLKLWKTKQNNFEIYIVEKTIP